MPRPREAKALALLEALQAFTDEVRGPTLRELAYRSLVAVRDAKPTMANLVRAGHVEIKGNRREAYCNKPVAVYGFPAPTVDINDASTALVSALSTWRP